MTKGFILGLVGVIVGAAVIGFLQKNPPTGIGGNFFSTESCSISTSTAGEVGPSGRHQLIATTSRRAWLQITSTTTPLYFGLNDVKARETHGYPLVTSPNNSTSTLTFDSQQVYTGAIRGWAAATTSISLVECSY